MMTVVNALRFPQSIPPRYSASEIELKAPGGKSPMERKNMESLPLESIKRQFIEKEVDEDKRKLKYDLMPDDK